MRPIEHEQTFYEQSLEDGQLDLREKNAYVYVEIAFKRPMVVFGWGISGKKGMLQGTGTERRGVVTEYVMKFMTQNSDWVFINNSKTGNEVYKNNFNRYILSLISFLRGMTISLNRRRRLIVLDLMRSHFQGFMSFD